MSEPTCTESAPCFACARCVRTMANVLRDDPNVRAHMTGVETRPAWRPAWKHAAEAGGTLRGDWSDGTITIEAEAGAVHIDRPHVATLPTGERVELPAGTVLREGGGGIDPAKLLQRIKDLQDDRSKQHAEIERLRAGHASMGGAFLDGFNEGVKAARAEAAGGMAAATIAEALRLVAVAGGTPPELAGLTLAAYNAARSGLKRGTSAKAGVAALMSAYTAGVERAIADHAKART